MDLVLRKTINNWRRNSYTNVHDKRENVVTEQQYIDLETLFGVVQKSLNLVFEKVWDPCPL